MSKKKMKLTKYAADHDVHRLIHAADYPHFSYYYNYKIHRDIHDDMIY